jgi:hypothetical protein
MKQFDNIIAKFERLSVEAETRKVISEQDVRHSIIMMNRKTLYNKGERTTGAKIKTYKAAPGQSYSTFTIKTKSKKQQPYDRVTLNDTGAFYKSMIVKVDTSAFKVDAIFEKNGENISKNLDIKDVLGLNENSLSKLSKQIKPKVLKNVRAAILQNNR